MQTGDHLYCMNVQVTLPHGGVEPIYKIGRAAGNFFVPPAGGQTLSQYLDQFPSKSDRKNARLYKVIEGLGRGCHFCGWGRNCAPGKSPCHTRPRKRVPCWNCLVGSERVAEDLERISRVRAGRGLASNWPGRLNALVNSNIAPEEWFLPHQPLLPYLQDINTRATLEDFCGVRFVQIGQSVPLLPRAAALGPTLPVTIDTFEYTNLKDAIINDLKRHNAALTSRIDELTAQLRKFQIPDEDSTE
jgi:hypothetical protein